MSKQIKKARKNIKLLEEADHLALANLPSEILKPEYSKVLTEQEHQLHHYLTQYADDYLPKSITKEYEFPPYFYYTTNSKKKGITHRRTRTDSAMFKRFLKNKSKLEMIKAQGLLKGEIAPIRHTIEFEGHKPIKAPKRKKIKAKMIDEYIDTGLPIHYMSEELEIPKSEYDLSGVQFISEPSTKQGKVFTIADLNLQPKGIEDLRAEILQLKRLEMMLSGAVDNAHVSQQIKEKEAELKSLEKSAKPKKSTKAKK